MTDAPKPALTEAPTPPRAAAAMEWLKTRVGLYLPAALAVELVATIDAAAASAPDDAMGVRMVAEG